MVVKTKNREVRLTPSQEEILADALTFYQTFATVKMKDSYTIDDLKKYYRLKKEIKKLDKKLKL